MSLLGADYLGYEEFGISSRSSSVSRTPNISDYKLNQPAVGSMKHEIRILLSDNLVTIHQICVL